MHVHVAWQCKSCAIDVVGAICFFWEGAKRTIKYLGWFVGGLFVNSYTSLPLVSYPRLTRSSKLADSQIENEQFFFEDMNKTILLNLRQFFQ